jgi:hypothetical protein
LEVLYIVGGNVKRYIHCEKVGQVLKILSWDPAIAFLGICPRELSMASQRDMCTPKFTVVFIHNM